MWQAPGEQECRPHEWAKSTMCARCGAFRCAGENRSGRCMNAAGHPDGTFHRYPDLASELVVLVDPRHPSVKAKGQEEPPDLQPA